MQSECYGFSELPEYRQRLVHRKRRRQADQSTWLSLAICAAILAIGTYLVWIGQFEIPTLDPRKNNQVYAVTFDADNSLRNTVFTATAFLHEVSDTETLHLINGDHPVKNEPDIGSMVPVRNLVPNGINDDVLRSDTLNAVSDLFNAARLERARVLYVSSGFRNYAQQQQVYDATMDKSYVQPPGFSEHQSGLAVDIMVLDVEMLKMGDSKEGRWLTDNVWKYGLILRYPADKQDATGKAYEPWHFRYIGQPHATYCHQNNLSFEEYIQLLKETGGYSMRIEDKQYFVLYEVPADDILNVPESRGFSVSSDNTGGFIITTWE